MKTPIHVFGLLLLASTVLATGQSGSGRLPCDYSGKLLQKDNGDIVRFDSDDMKSRATHKVDISDFMKRTDIKGTAIIDVVVGPSGEVVCAKTRLGQPLLRSEVEKAIRAWTFKSEKVDSEPIAYVGRMEFYLCNISCGEQSFSMSIVK